jgi:Mrp family chromosome partitioning ATPase
VLVTGPGVTDRAQFAGALGLTVAEAGARALLVEADFDAPQLHQVLSLSTPTGAGFSQQLMARRQARHPEPWVVMRCTNNLQVLAEGRFRSPGLVATREFEAALGELGDQYHVIIVHAPALSRPDDLRPLGALAQAALLVSAGRPSELKVADDPLRGLV